MNRRATRSAAWPVLGALLVIPAPAASAASLSEAAQEAEKPAEEQNVLGREEPSQTKSKEKAPAGQPRTGGECETSGGWLEFAIEIWNVLSSDSEGGSSASHDPVPAAEPEPPPPLHLRVGMTAAGGRVAEDSFGVTGTGGALVGVARGRLCIDLRGQYARGRFPEDLRPGLGGLHGWSGDVVFRWRLSDPYFRAGVDLVLTGRWGTYQWDYTNPVQVATAYGVRTVERDSIHHGTLLAGVGIVPFARGDWSLGLTVAGGYRRFDGVTAEGFENDVFEDGPFVEGRVELVFSPRR